MNHVLRSTLLFLALTMVACTGDPTPSSAPDDGVVGAPPVETDTVGTNVATTSWQLVKCDLEKPCYKMCFYSGGVLQGCGKCNCPTTQAE